VTGLALIGAGSLVLTRVSVHGGVARHESGLASGLSNTALQTGAHAACGGDS
jgi:hypothetical protein